MSKLLPTEQLLAELIRIPSVNPAGNPGVEQPGEARCAAYLADLLRQMGAQVETWDVEPGRPNVLGKFPANQDSKPVLLLAPHTDTVSVQGMTIEPFFGELKDGKVYGRGASDTKGPMAAMLAALADCQEFLPELPVEIWFAGLMGEEAGQLGARDFCKRYRPDFVIVAEPTELQIVNVHKGCIWMDIRTTGAAVHASTPELGENAVLKMLDLLQYLRNQLQPKLATFQDTLLGQPTINIGTLQGGSKVNIVPDACSCGVDIRTVPVMDCDQLMAETTAAMRRLVPDVQLQFAVANALATEPSHPMIMQLQDCGARLTQAPWFCDAAVFGASGIPGIALGPGNIAQAHTRDEFISLDDLHAGEQFFVKFLESLACSDCNHMKLAPA